MIFLVRNLLRLPHTKVQSTTYILTVNTHLSLILFVKPKLTSVWRRSFCEERRGHKAVMSLSKKSWTGEGDRRKYLEVHIRSNTDTTQVPLEQSDLGPHLF